VKTFAKRKYFLVLKKNFKESYNKLNNELNEFGILNTMREKPVYNKTKPEFNKPKSK